MKVVCIGLAMFGLAMGVYAIVHDWYLDRQLMKLERRFFDRKIPFDELYGYTRFPPVFCWDLEKMLKPETRKKLHDEED